jgi:sarcosine oxidase subunit beta
VTRRADVVVIGAGVVGCSLAFYLARAGRSVIVLDRGLLGQGATAACAGGVRAQFSTEVNIRIGMEAKRRLAAFEPEVGRSADFRQVGYLFLLSTTEEREEFAQAVRLQRRLGVDDVVELSPQEAGELVPGLRCEDLSGATYCPSDGLAGPNEVTSGYAAAARGHGATILEQTPVTALPRRAGVVCGIETAKGSIDAGQVVICTGPSTAAVGRLAGVTLPVSPSRRHAFVTEAFDGIGRFSPMTIDFHSSFYFHPEGDGLLFGMSDAEQAESAEAIMDWSVLERIVPRAAERWPPLLEARVKNGWAGLYENTPDSQPLVGHLGDNLWVAAGFSGHGFMMGPVIGDWLAQWMTAGAPPVDLSSFSPNRFSDGRSVPEHHVV